MNHLERVWDFAFGVMLIHRLLGEASLPPRFGRSTKRDGCFDQRTMDEHDILYRVFIKSKHALSSPTCPVCSYEMTENSGAHCPKAASEQSNGLFYFRAQGKTRKYGLVSTPKQLGNITLPVSRGGLQTIQIEKAEYALL